MYICIVSFIIVFPPFRNINYHLHVYHLPASRFTPPYPSTLKKLVVPHQQVVNINIWCENLRLIKINM